MNYRPVKSSRIASVGYDESSCTSEIRFHQLATPQYQQVPACILRGLLIVVSKGRFYDGVIKGKFPEIKVKRCQNVIVIIVHKVSSRGKLQADT